MPRILLAEDDDSLRGFLARALERAGYEVRSCADGDEALVALEDGDWDLLLTDIVMPGTDGIEVARQAAARSGRLRIMFITGFAAVALAAGRGAGVVQARASARDRGRSRTDDGRGGLIRAPRREKIPPPSLGLCVLRLGWLMRRCTPMKRPICLLAAAPATGGAPGGDQPALLPGLRPARRSARLCSASA